MQGLKTENYVSILSIIVIYHGILLQLMAYRDNIHAINWCKYNVGNIDCF